MSIARLRTKRVLIPSLAAVVALGIGGVVWASSVSSAAADPVGGQVVRAETSDHDRDDRDADDRLLSTSERGSASRAATDAVGGGTVTDIEASDDRGVAYEVDVRLADGTEWDVDLDAAFAVVHKSIDR